MNAKLINYIRKYHSWELSGKVEAMQCYRAAYLDLNKNWPDYEHVKKLKDTYSREELICRHEDWERRFPMIALDFYNEHIDRGKFNLCPKCGEVARSPTFERCECCDSTWVVSGDGRNS